jgi:hypothetical protein
MIDHHFVFEINKEQEKKDKEERESVCVCLRAPMFSSNKGWGICIGRRENESDQSFHRSLCCCIAIGIRIAACVKLILSNFLKTNFSTINWWIHGRMKPMKAMNQ